ncbi:MAG: S9 family peptidase [Ignavibacterium sp.]|nr:S9 family peptidase [Ignavibacterium sp.]MDW8374899.1 DPP IV N-terminal domain-containing protein [Ignavibacteriales bacterium]
MKKFQAIIFALIIVLTSFSSFAQNKKLSFQQVYLFAEPRLFNSPLQILKWLDDENYLIQKRNPFSIVKVNAKTGSEEIFIDFSEYDDILLEYELTIDSRIAVSNDYKGYLFEKDDNLYYFNIDDNKVIQLTNQKAKRKNPTFSPDGKKVAYTINNNLFYVDVNKQIETQLTFDGNDTIKNGYASWVYYEEILGRASNYRAFYWSPNSEMIAFLRMDDSPVPKFPLYIADGNRGKLEWEFYPKAGEPNPNVSLHIAHIKNNKIIDVEEDNSLDQYTAWVFWTPDSKELFYQVLNRGQDHLQILAANPQSGKSRFIYEEKQDSFVEFFEDIYILKENKGFILRSDKSGYRHLYWYDMSGNLKKQITDGNWTVTKIVLVDEENQKIYFEGNKDNSLENHLYVVSFDGKNLIRMTKSEGTHSTRVSEKGSYFITTYSSVTNPGFTELCNSKGELIKVLLERKKEIFNEYEFGKVELFKIKTSDNVELPAMWVLPPKFDKSKKYPVLFSIYGGPGGKDVRNSFSMFLDRFFISQNDIIYFVVDHRGSEHFGKKGMSLMHRNLGKWEMNDYIETVKYLKTLPFVDTTKIGITGGSYGGYLTCLALTQGADYFNYGVSDFPVTDWKLYDNIYTERYMDTPVENPDGYKQGSVLTYADKYKGYLLITHGTLDDNVHMQNTIQLIDKLISLNKDFEVMLYPNERHGYGFPKRNHQYREYVQFWFRHLLNKDFKLEEN